MEVVVVESWAPLCALEVVLAVRGHLPHAQAELLAEAVESCDVDRSKVLSPSMSHGQEASLMDTPFELCSSYLLFLVLDIQYTE